MQALDNAAQLYLQRVWAIRVDFSVAPFSSLFNKPALHLNRKFTEDFRKRNTFCFERKRTLFILNRFPAQRQPSAKKGQRGRPCCWSFEGLEQLRTAGSSQGDAGQGGRGILKDPDLREARQRLGHR